MAKKKSLEETMRENLLAVGIDPDEVDLDEYFGEGDDSATGMPAKKRPPGEVRETLIYALQKTPLLFDNNKPLTADHDEYVVVLRKPWFSGLVSVHRAQVKDVITNDVRLRSRTDGLTLSFRKDQDPMIVDAYGKKDKMIQSKLHEDIDAKLIVNWTLRIRNLKDAERLIENYGRKTQDPQVIVAEMVKILLPKLEAEFERLVKKSRDRATALKKGSKAQIEKDLCEYIKNDPLWSLVHVEQKDVNLVQFDIPQVERDAISEAKQMMNRVNGMKDPVKEIARMMREEFKDFKDDYKDILFRELMAAAKGKGSTGTPNPVEFRDRTSKKS